MERASGQVSVQWGTVNRADETLMQEWSRAALHTRVDRLIHPECPQAHSMISTGIHGAGVARDATNEVDTIPKHLKVPQPTPPRKVHRAVSAVPSCLWLEISSDLSTQGKPHPGGRR